MKFFRKNAAFILLLLFVQNLSYGIYPPPVIGKQGMVVTDQAIASQVGIDILKQGGNAIDAAVAVGYALAVVHPCCGNIGGGGFMLIHLAKGSNVFLNFRERAPLAANKNMYLDQKGHLIPNKSLQGYTAVAVPGTVMGLNIALAAYGSLPLATVIAPAIKLAEQGYILTDGDIKILNAGTAYFSKEKNIAAIFLNQNQPYVTGDRLIQKDLAKTLKLIAQQGNDAFYQGSIAQTIVKASKQQGGILTQEDFTRFYVEKLNPIQCTYHGYIIVSAPPPSSGGTTLCETLNILASYPLSVFGFHSAAAIHFIVEALRYAFYDRNHLLGDPDFINNPTARLLSTQYAATIRKKISDYRATPSIKEQNTSVNPESRNTTHYSIVDQWGNTAAVTYTLNGYFGSKVIAGDTGFFLNNEMDDFSSKPGTPNQFGLVQGDRNAIQPGKRP